MKKIGVLALQGAVQEPMEQIHRVGAKAFYVKHKNELTDLDGLIIPGGESTVISRLIEKNNLHDPIRNFSARGGAVLGTCAGLILCSSTLVSSHNSNERIRPLRLLDITTERNGFGRQKDSFESPVQVSGLDTPIPAVFIRAPYILSVGPNVEILAKLDNRIIMARQNRCLVSAFHPELTSDLRIMQYFLSLME